MILSSELKITSKNLSGEVHEISYLSKHLLISVTVEDFSAM